MIICLINISDETDVVQSEITYVESTTALALTKILIFFVKNNVHYISVTATNEDAVITFNWDRPDWHYLCDQAAEEVS
ncbi:hypothetical protein I302_104239 [Kwoniella bestiolae CBS 10118]|uniref:Uncharacterized protein n=1 Tax=Kwoniella bestiolae CBS 10118 TaxID=1296100 RepID=A0A1B9GAP6_9TREE|nr:hypothetical protein I302_02948 [Kwoniella bestiolae CBS 10118]OCF28097.1 hypothetical protein I302_02948 [Kwoniella bestiolae CBS 10118]